MTFDIHNTQLRVDFFGFVQTRNGEGHEIMEGDAGIRVQGQKRDV